MRAMCAGYSFQGYPIEQIEHRGATADEEHVSTVSWYGERLSKCFWCFTCLSGVGALIFLTYVTYHVISKIRGNNNYIHNHYG